MDDFYTLKRTEKGVCFLGIDMGGYGKILAENMLYIIIKWPGHQSWSGRGETKYYPTSTAVYAFIEDNKVKKLIEWDKGGVVV